MGLKFYIIMVSVRHNSSSTKKTKSKKSVLQIRLQGKHAIKMALSSLLLWTKTKDKGKDWFLSATQLYYV